MNEKIVKGPLEGGNRVSTVIHMHTRSLAQLIIIQLLRGRLWSTAFI
jgi:hypothetical protein